MRVPLENPWFLFVTLFSVKINVSREGEDRAMCGVWLSEGLQLPHEKGYSIISL